MIVSNLTIVNILLPRILSEARDQEVFPDLTGSESIKILGFDRASIEAIPPDICTMLPKLQSLWVITTIYLTRYLAETENQ